MNNGYIKLWRKIIDTSFFKHANTLQLAIYILLEANHKAYKMIYNKKEMTIERGQLVTGAFKIKEITGLSRQNIRTSLHILSNIGFLTIKSTNKFSLISVCNYNEYQKDTTDKVTNNLTINQPSTNHQLTTIQEVKECKEVLLQPAVEEPNRTTEIREFYYNAYKQKFNNPYVAAYAKDGAIFKNLLKVIEPEKLKQYISKFFDSEDSFIVKSTYDVGIFKSQINKLQAAKGKNDY